LRSDFRQLIRLIAASAGLPATGLCAFVAVKDTNVRSAGFQINLCARVSVVLREISSAAIKPLLTLFGTISRSSEESESRVMIEWRVAS
jgi:hypothetical protein